MKKSILFIISLLFGIPLFAQLPTVTAEEVGMSSSRLERITTLSKDYVESNRVASIVTMVARQGKVVYFDAFGSRSMDDDTPVKKDDLFRIYSMTKPITAIAAMQLYEQGKFHLSDPVTKYIPELKDLKIMNEDGEMETNTETMTMQQLLTHTAGFSYGFNPKDPVDKAYGKAEIWTSKDLDDFVQKIAALPLKYKPGEKWHYSIAVDLTGVIIERLSGESLADYFQNHIFKPLGMTDTFFEVPQDKKERFLPNHYFDYASNKPVTIKKIEDSAMSDYYKVTLYSGGGGLVSTAMDYMLFSECLRNGGELNGNRIIGPKTINFMTRNHLAASISQGGTGENIDPDSSTDGFGFGLGFGIMTDATAQKVIGSEGEYSWGGAAGTVFWVDPIEDIVVVSMIQLMSSPWNLRGDLKVATYQALNTLNKK